MFAQKSFSKSQILLRDYYNEREIMVVIHEMVDEVAMRLRLHHAAARKITLAISYSRDIEERDLNIKRSCLDRQTARKT
ncbi:hypothetical protein [Bacillus sp. PK3_68]|uniref:DinB/UmuC family translesion DNA polymerase n=1 Tax=Bacillus sp. PK3_68 TaxID=2027408 RepID=UPI0015FF5496|nr:hypothetical protein [Bacillus sp. PK3_68]